MYSGLVLTRYSGRLMGAHQKINRITHRHVREILPTESFFPQLRTILQFEGKNGPDGVKRKDPGNEPWHLFDPFATNNDAYAKLLRVHYKGLVEALKKKDTERSGFEAAWLAHAIVDGLTPAHHYPFDEKVSELRGGKTSDSRSTIWEKWIFKRDTLSKTIMSTSKAWGPKGIFTSHVLFEAGFTFIIRPLRFPDARPTKTDLNKVASIGYEAYFFETARTVARMRMFEEYLRVGWTPKLSRQLRNELAPLIVKTVTTLWYQAVLDAQGNSRQLLGNIK